MNTANKIEEAEEEQELLFGEESLDSKDELLLNTQYSIGYDPMGTISYNDTKRKCKNELLRRR
jgi:hypothetical protein